MNGTSGSQPPPTPGSPSLSPTDQPFTGRAAFAISQIYYYAAAVVGVGFVIGGAIGALIGLRALVLPSSTETSREAIRTMLDGIAFAAPGAAFGWWHLREARRREGAVTPAFWGGSLYFHLVSFIAAVTVLGGVTACLTGLVEAALPQKCVSFRGVDLCNDAADALRGAINAAIVVFVAGAVWWWHLREARRPPDVSTGVPAALL